MTYPLRSIVSRPDRIHETLECGHIILRPLGLGEDATKASTTKRRRCYRCGDAPKVQQAPQPRKRGAPAQARGVCAQCGKTGLGNTYHAHGRGSYRQCRYCDEVTFL